MRLPLPAVVIDWLIRRSRRSPYPNIGNYMERGWLLRCDRKKAWPPFGARIHHVLRSDHDRALHDHPWWNLSWVLRGGYWEVTSAAEARPGVLRPEAARLIELLGTLDTAAGLAHATEAARLGVFWRGPGAMVRRSAATAHRLVVPKGGEAWSLFVMGKKSQWWGFITPEGKMYWRAYLRRYGREV
ncbi:hypothetical protein [Derxia gummosa]|uniref:Uncharacterized protein n=1 Tax=Derxia gummosa DSM 723 TaxID=1121388 RepID=A0A8B6X8Y3_9BURK|nr:hypothetical protein [Derxia gummosa]